MSKFEKDVAGAMSPTKIFVLVLAIVTTVVLMFCATSLVESVDADEIMVVQSPMSGKLSWYTTAGLKWQGFGKVTIYKKRDFYDFDIQVRFNDGGHANMRGSIQYEMPLGVDALTELHTKFGSAEAIQKQLVETVTNKSVYMTGPLMSSKESYAEKRNDLIHYVEDQVSHGVYKTTQRDQRIEDPILKTWKTVTVVDLVTKDGVQERQEEAVLESFGIKTFNFSIVELKYDDDVEEQIKQQQQITMDVQTAIAGAKKAEQKKITVDAEGAAEAAVAKWEQEKEKAKRVVQAEQEKEVAELAGHQRLEVARLDRAAAEQEKQRQIFLGEGESERRRKVMEADGALTQKLETYATVNGNYAKAIAEHKGNWVPAVVMGSSSDGQTSTTAGSGAMELIQLLMVKTAKDLALDFGFSNSTANRVIEK